MSSFLSYKTIVSNSVRLSICQQTIPATMWILLLFVTDIAAIESCPEGKICVEKCCPHGEIFNEDHFCISR